ncbi:MAG: hypothetical protein JNL81_15820 [Hyphomonadaceae bacterium]|nr:hypothetical protein [Hyphomonadaceae bacterium]
MAGAETETRQAIAGLRLLVAAAAFAPAPAAAGAWIAPEGGQNILTSTLVDHEETVTYEGSGYYEAPVREDTSLVLAPWVETNPELVTGWRAEATAGVKHVFYRTDENVMALQAGALWVSMPDAGCGEGGAEVRWLGGSSFNEGRAFLNVEAAARALSGGCEGGRLDVTAGYRPRENWLAMGQVFLDSPVEGHDTVRAQLTLVRFNNEGTGLQIGVRARLDGEDLEPALVIGLWRRGRD